MPTYENVRMQLRHQLNDLLRRVAKIEGDLRSVHDPDWVERASELENDEVLAGLDEVSRAEVQQTRAALERIESGRYGICATCAEAIPAERLEAMPTTVLCLKCATKA